MSGVHVASMLHRGFGTVWKWLEMLGSNLQHMQHEKALAGISEIALSL